jgi:hypothetical protein
LQVGWEGGERDRWEELARELNEFIGKLDDLMKVNFGRAASQYRVFKENLYRRYVNGELPKGSLEWALCFLFRTVGQRFPGVRNPYDSPL